MTVMLMDFVQIKKILKDMLLTLCKILQNHSHPTIFLKKSKYIDQSQERIQDSP